MSNPRGVLPKPGAASTASPQLAKPDASKASSLSAARIALLRRKLTVSSDNPKVDGYAEDAETPKEDVSPVKEEDISVIDTYTGLSKKGFAPFNTGKKNQDSFVMRTDPATSSLLLGVMDGHGEVGHLVSDFVKQNLPAVLFHDPSWKTDVPAAIKRSVATVESKLLKVRTISTQFSGTTLVFCVIRKNQIFVGNVGDSRLIIGKTVKDVVEAIPISIDHKPDLPVEKSRIIAAGGRVFGIQYDDELGPPRVWLKNMDIPGLAMSRSIGDTVAHSVGVSADVEIFVHEITPADKYLIIASDGLWEFMSNEQVMSIVTAHDKLGDAINDLFKISSDLWLKSEQVIDDTTVIIVRFK